MPESTKNTQESPTSHIKFESSVLEYMDILIDDGFYYSRNELIRDAVRHLLEPHHNCGRIAMGVRDRVGRKLMEHERQST